MLVTLVGYDIMKGRSLLVSTSASDYAHFLIACLFHEIGYVRGILRGDSEEGYIIDASEGKVKLPRGSSDAALMPYHVDRSKLYVTDWMGESKHLDASRICRAIEFTRLPAPTAVFGASLPNRALSASWKSPVDTPRRYDRVGCPKHTSRRLRRTPRSHGGVLRPCGLNGAFAPHGP